LTPAGALTISLSLGGELDRRLIFFNESKRRRDVSSAANES